MKKLGSIFGLVLFLCMFVVGPVFAGVFADQIEPIFSEALVNVIGLLGIVVLFYVRKFVTSVTTKLGIEQHEALILAAAEKGVHVAEEWGHRKIKNGGIAKTGAEKFEMAVAKAKGFIPFPIPDSLIEDQVVAAVGKARAAGFNAASGYVGSKFPTGD